MWLKVMSYKGEMPISFQESISVMDCSFNVSQACVGCKLCGKVCPVSNITYHKYRPVFKHNCEQCYACVAWCPPQKAIVPWEGKATGLYRHPELRVEDIL